MTALVPARFSPRFRSNQTEITLVTWSNNRGGSGTASGTTSWNVAGVVLQTGVNVITVSARDAAGNTGTAVLSVTYTTADMVAPVVTISGPTTADTFVTTASGIRFRGFASDNTAVTLVTVANDRGGVINTRRTSHWTQWTAWVDLLIGRNVLTVTARDAAGNVSTDVITVHRSQQ